MRKEIKLWLRLGDSAEYQPYDSIEEIKELFRQLKLRKDFKRSQTYGIENSNYENLNYVSLFYGDKEAQPTKEITDFELNYLNE